MLKPLNSLGTRLHSLNNRLPISINRSHYFAQQYRAAHQAAPAAAARKSDKSATYLREGLLFDPITTEPLIRPRDLRNGCRCSLCVHPSDRQRQYNIAHIPQSIQVASHTRDDQGDYLIHWKNDVPGFPTDHSSRYTKQDIEEYHTALATKRQVRNSRKVARRLWSRDEFDISQNTFDYEELMNENVPLASALQRLDTLGLIFLSNVPQDESSVASIASRIGVLRSTFYGSTWDVRNQVDAKNVAYTSRDLGFHMDLLYMAESPGFQLLHCMENTCEGGLSKFVDTFKVLDLLCEERGPRILELLRWTSFLYEYKNDGRLYHRTKPVISRGDRIYEDSTWPEKLRREPQLRVNWSPPFVSSSIHYQRVTNNASPDARDEAVREFADGLERPAMAVTTKLPPGTCAIFDNLRIVHARTAFDTSSGHRWLRGAYTDHQDVHSTMERLKDFMPQEDK
jgi:gamma-butyrobetaine dioxygenase